MTGEDDARRWQDYKTDDVNGYPPEAVEKMVDESLALTSQLLVRRGKVDAAKAMLQIVRHEIQYTYDFGEDRGMLWLEYEPESADLFDRNLEEPISDVWYEIVRRREYPADLNQIGFREVLPIVYPGWREQLAEILNGERRSNHARRAREEDPRWTEDQLFFTNAGELDVYRALKWRQENSFMAGETIGIFPLSRGRIPGHTWEPDFIVTYKGIAGIIEVDSPYHDGRRDHDLSREELFKDAGISVVYRIPVEGFGNPGELGAHLDRFFRRLSTAR